MASSGKPSGITADTSTASTARQSYLSTLTNVNGSLYFTNGSINGQQLWKTDSTGNAVLVKDINSGANLSEIWSLTKLMNNLRYQI
jgi:ELWxxDGT repeat protein